MIFLEPGDAGLIILLVFLLVCSAFFSSAETAFTCLNKIRIRSEADNGSKKAALILSLIDDPSKLLSTVLVGNNLVNIAASSISTSLMIRIFGNAAVGITTGALTLIILIFCEVSPKTLASRKAERIAYRYVGLIRFLMTIFTPITFVVGKLSEFFISLFGPNSDSPSAVITEKELRTIVDVSSKEGVLETDESDMINNVVDFGDRVAKDVMVPVINMKCVPVTVSYEGLIKAFKEDEYSRMPVYSGSKDNIVGIIWAKDLILKYVPGTPFKIESIMRPASFTYEFKKTRELMADMREEFHSLVIVLDEYGVTSGLITIEDLLEEIVGEIKDEYDRDEVDPVTVIGKDEFEVPGQLSLTEIEDRTGILIDTDDYDSIAGHVVHLLGHIPTQGETVSDGLAEYTVLQMDGKRISRLMIKKLPSETPDSEE